MSVKLREVSINADPTLENRFCPKNDSLLYSHTGYFYLYNIFIHVFNIYFFIQMNCEIYLE